MKPKLPTPGSNATFGAGGVRRPGTQPIGSTCIRRSSRRSGSSASRQLLAHARVDGRLHAVSVIDGRARLHDLGPVDDVNERIEALTFSLHRLNRIQGSDESRLAAAEMLYAFADELAEIVLPPIVAESFDPVVIVPTAILHDVPWGLLPPLAGRSVSVNPSVSAWGHAERTLRERRGTLHDGIEAGFVAGPGLDFADVEVKHLAGGYVDPVVLVGEEATVAACRELLSRAELVHIACHGSFRRDNPMFSSLHVADGPLNIYDLESLPRLPVVVVLSSCSVANAKVVQGGSLLGLANAFTTLGAASVIAPLTPISDAAAVTVMDRLHREIVAGADPAAALAAATMTHDVADPTAAAFIALGVAPIEVPDGIGDCTSDCASSRSRVCERHSRPERKSARWAHQCWVYLGGLGGLLIVVTMGSATLISPGLGSAAVESDNAALLARVVDGEESAWNELVDRFAGLVWSVARSFHLAAATTDDVVQTVWLRLAEYCSRIREPDRLAAWLATATRNEALRVIRGNSAWSRTLDSPSRASRRAARSRTSSPTTSPCAPC